jgi:hypothetical protein
MNKLFKQIYGGADEEKLREQWSSFQTSGGTVLYQLERGEGKKIINAMNCSQKDEWKVGRIKLSQGTLLIHGSSGYRMKRDFGEQETIALLGVV